jgi:predicted esterase
MSRLAARRVRALFTGTGIGILAAFLVVRAQRNARARPATRSSARSSVPDPSSNGRQASLPHPKPPRDTRPFWLNTGGGGRALVYPPLHAGKQPLAVMLHGMCDVPQNECPWFAPAVTPHAWLVCPRARIPCRGGGARWSGESDGTVSAAARRLEAARPGEVETTRDGLLIGFSQGAYAAMSIVARQPHHWSRLLLIAAHVSPNAWLLNRDGIERVLLAAGDYDMTHGPMRVVAKRLARGGYPARFMSLGKVGHTFPSDMEQRMTDAVSWLGL